MIQQSNDSKPPIPPMVVWIIWFSILAGLVMMQVLVAGGIPSGPDHEPVPMVFKLVAVTMATASLAIRFFVIPKRPGLHAKLPAMIIGLALAEGAGIIGAFLLDQRAGATRLTVFLMALLCILLSAPVYVSSSHPKE